MRHNIITTPSNLNSFKNILKRYETSNNNNSYQILMNSLLAEITLSNTNKIT